MYGDFELPTDEENVMMSPIPHRSEQSSKRNRKREREIGREERKRRKERRREGVDKYKALPVFLLEPKRTEGASLTP